MIDADEPALSPYLYARAFRHRSGLTWRYSDAIGVAEVLPSLGRAILGCEIWAVVGNREVPELGEIPAFEPGLGFYRALPLVNGEIEAYRWDTDIPGFTPWSDEPWKTLCARTAPQAVAHLATARTVASEISSAVREHLWYHLDLVTQAEFIQLFRGRGWLWVSKPSRRA